MQILLELCPRKQFTTFLPFIVATVKGFESLFPIPHGFTCDHDPPVLMIISGN